MAYEAIYNIYEIIIENKIRHCLLNYFIFYLELRLSSFLGLQQLTEK